MLSGESGLPGLGLKGDGPTRGFEHTDIVEAIANAEDVFRGYAEFFAQEGDDVGFAELMVRAAAGMEHGRREGDFAACFATCEAHQVGESEIGEDPAAND